MQKIGNPCIVVFVRCISMNFFEDRFYFIILKAVTERELVSTDSLPSESWDWEKLGARNSIQVCPVGGRAQVLGLLSRVHY